MSEDSILIIPQGVSAIAIDANACSRGLLDLSAIRSLISVIDDQQLNIEIWIPEPVLWEWAEHAHALASKARAETQSNRKALRLIGLEQPIVPEYSFTIHEMIEHLEEKLSDLSLNWNGAEAIRVLRLRAHPQLAVDGIRDQILQYGAGRKKQDTKTGAADSASLRLITEEASGRLENVVLVSGDADVRRHFGTGDLPTLIGSIWATKSELQKLRRGSDVAIEAVKNTVLSDLTSLSEVDLLGVPVIGKPDTEDFEFIPFSIHETTMRIVRVVRVIEVKDIQVSAGDSTATAIAIAEVDVEVDYLTWDAHNESLDSETAFGFDVPASVYLSIDLSENGEGVATVDELEF